MSDISQLKETLDQIQATQQTLVEKVDKLVEKSELLGSLQKPCEVTQEVPQEKPEKHPEIDPLARIEEIPKEVCDKISEDNKYDLGNGLHYYEEDGICYIDVDKDDEIVDAVRAKIVSTDLIREYIKNGEFEKIKQYVPEDTYNALNKEYQAWKKVQDHKLTDDEKKRINEQQKLIDAKSKKLNEVLKQLSGKMPNWKRKQLTAGRDILRSQIKQHGENIEKIKRGG